MIPYFYVLDEFFPNYEFDLLRDYALRLEYKDQVAPFDGVTYKNIGLPVPDGALMRISTNLSWLLGYKVMPKHCAFRLSLEGSSPPQWAHSDAEVARFGMFIYLNPGPGGTVLLEHKLTGMRQHPRTMDELDAWRFDHNDPDKWEIRASIDSAPNRAVVLQAGLIHAALPFWGFGDGVHNGRLILLCFFD